MTNDDFYMNIFIFPTNFQKESQILYIKHPRTNSPSPFLVSANKIYELLEVDRNPSSFLFARQVISNGKIFLTVEFHPLFLALPLILDRKSEFYSLDGFFDDTDLKQIELLIKPYFYLVCQQSKISGYTVWSLDTKKMLDWLCIQISKLVSHMEEIRQYKHDNTNIEKSSVNAFNNNCLVESAFDMIRHYIKASIAEMLKIELQQRYPNSFQNNLIQPKQSHKKLTETQSRYNSVDSSPPIISPKETLYNQNQKKIDKSKIASSKSAETKKKKKNIKIPKRPIESFFNTKK